jgi:hypothetical protein
MIMMTVERKTFVFFIGMQLLQLFLCDVRMVDR